MSNKMQNDTKCIEEWRTLIGAFNKAVENAPPPSKVEEELLALKEMAKTNAHLTSRQMEAIIARVDNYLSGEYGKSKISVN